ncbi:DUF4167 domain-containing protein [Acidisoma sp. C75]
MRHQGANANGVPLNRNHVFDSNGPDIRVRGTAQQLFEKYLQLGRDATSAGDRVLGEGYFQHAEHYFRIVTAMNQAAAQHQQQQQSVHQRRATSDEAGGADETEQGEGEEEMRPVAVEAREIPIAVAAPEA